MSVLICTENEILRRGILPIAKENTLVAENLQIMVSLFTSHEIKMLIIDLSMPGNEILENLIPFIKLESKLIVFSEGQVAKERICAIERAGAHFFYLEKLTIDEIKKIYNQL